MSMVEIIFYIFCFYVFYRFNRDLHRDIHNDNEFNKDLYR